MAKVDKRKTRKMKCPVAGCRKKTRGPRYNWYCEDHEGKSSAAKAKGLVKRRASDIAPRTRQAKPERAPRKPRNAGSQGAPVTPQDFFASALAFRCAHIGSLAGMRCVLVKHPTLHHVFAGPMSVPPSARTSDEIEELARIVESTGTDPVPSDAEVTAKLDEVHGKGPVDNAADFDPPATPPSFAPQKADGHLPEGAAPLPVENAATPPHGSMGAELRTHGDASLPADDL